MSYHAHINPSADQTKDINSAITLNNEAGFLSRTGDLAGAEKKHLEALAIKIRSLGEDSIGVALTKNSLEELYLPMEGLDDTQKIFDYEDRQPSFSIHLPDSLLNPTYEHTHKLDSSAASTSLVHQENVRITGQPGL